MRTCAQINQSLGERAAVLAESVGERPHRHAVVLTSRRWRGGRDSAVAETRRDNLIYAMISTSRASTPALQTSAGGPS